MNQTLEEQLRGEKVAFIQEGNGIREEAIKLLDRLQNFHPKIYKRKRLREIEADFLRTYKNFLDYDKRVGLWCETLAMAMREDGQKNFIGYPTLEERTWLSITVSDLSLQRETLRNLLRDVENRLNNYGEILNNRVIRFVAWTSLIVAGISMLLTIISIGLDELTKIQEFSKKAQSISFENVHNQQALTQHITELKDNKVDFGASHYYFLTDFYKNNWEIISKLPDQCVKTYFDLVISMEAANGVNDSLIKTYNDSSLLFNEVQAANTKKIIEKWGTALNNQLTRISGYFTDINNDECSNFKYFLFF